MSRGYQSLLGALLASLTLLLPTVARADGRIRICSQNLHRYGEVSPRKRGESREQQRAFLVRRFLDAECDVVAVQEVVGSSRSEAQCTLEEIATAWSRAIDRPVRAIVGESRDEYIRNGFLLAEGRARLLETKSYLDAPLPRLQPLGPVGRFLRPPLALVLELPNGQRVMPMNIHFKSKSRGYLDPSGTNYENVRMEMAEGVRAILAEEERRRPAGTLFVVLGDRNSDLSSAASAVLSGSRTLEDFRRGDCSVSDDLTPQCSGSALRPARLVGLFEARSREFPGEYPRGSYRYKGREELLDEIFVPAPDLARAKRPNGRYAIGLEGQFYKGSDHKLVWLELGW